MEKDKWDAKPKGPPWGGRVGQTRKSACEGLLKADLVQQGVHGLGRLAGLKACGYGVQFANQGGVFLLGFEKAPIQTPESVDFHFCFFASGRRPANRFQAMNDVGTSEGLPTSFVITSGKMGWQDSRRRNHTDSDGLNSSTIRKSGLKRDQSSPASIMRMSVEMSAP